MFIGNIKKKKKNPEKRDNAQRSCPLLSRKPAAVFFLGRFYTYSFNINTIFTFSSAADFPQIMLWTSINFVRHISTSER